MIRTHHQKSQPLGHPIREILSFANKRFYKKGIYRQTQRFRLEGARLDCLPHLLQKKITAVQLDCTIEWGLQ